MKDLKEMFIENMKSKRLECRAWDIRNEEMMTVDDMQWYNPEPFNFNGIVLKPKKNQPLIINTKSAWKTEDEIILMWHFGHLDKNQNKVFEGDIIKFCEDDCFYMVVYYDKYLSELCLQDIDGTIFLLCDFLDENGNVNGEIVGNIFENYKLLEEQEER